MRVLSPPIELVDVAAFKRAVHMHDEETDDDALIASLLVSARAVVETATASPMVAADYLFEVPACGFCFWWFPVRPVNVLTAVEWRSDGSEWQAVDPAHVFLRSEFDEPKLVFQAAAQDVIAAADEVRVRANIGGAIVAQQNQAVILLAKEWRDAGISLEAVQAHELSFPVQRLIRQVRYRRPKVLA